MNRKQAFCLSVWFAAHNVSIFLTGKHGHGSSGFDPDIGAWSIKEKAPTCEGGFQGKVLE